MSEIRYGHVEGPGKGREYKMAATQYFGRLGGKFCYLAGGTGHITAATSTATFLFGWVDIPKDTTGAATTWVSSGTAGKDKCFVIYGVDDKFEMPYQAANGVASCLATSLLGEAAEIYVSGSTTSTVQQCGKLADPAASQAVLVIYDVDETNDTVIVGIRPEKRQPKGLG